MALIVSGQSLHGNADRNSAYLLRRDPDVLRRLGALGADHAAIMDRADKIGLGNKNNISDAQEVDRLHEPAVHATLFPDEQRALGTVWDRFHVDTLDFPTPDVPAINAGSFTSVPGSFGAVDTEQPILIADLPLPSQQISRRVQLTIDRDRSPPTIQYADILNALLPNNADKYTRQELDLIRELQQRFLNEILPRSITPPNVDVPELGEHRYPLAAEPGINVELVSKNELKRTQSRELHTRSSRVSLNGTTNIYDRLQFSRTPIAINFEVPANHRMVVISAAGEQIHEAGTAALAPIPGQYIFELYDLQGRKVRDKGFTVPDVAVKQDLGAEHNGKPVTSNGRPMEAELVSYDRQPLSNRTYGTRDFVNGTYHAVEWTFVPEGTANHHGDVAAARASFTWPEGQLRDGTYSFLVEHANPGRTEVPEQNATLEKYPGALFSATINGEKFWLRPDAPSNYGDPKLNGLLSFRAAGRDVTVTFEPKTNTLSIARLSADRRITNHWKHAIKDADFTETPNTP